MSYSMPVNLIVVLCFVIFLCYLLGIYNTLIHLGGNECEMTYMFEFPQFVEISLPTNIRQTNPRYGLYGYAEGRRTEKLREMHFRGNPVLFIPGSSGSYKQGRSLASVSLKKSIDIKEIYHFDYFMIDFNEDHSALYGGTLETQAKFVRQCIVKIMTLYMRANITRPRSVVLIGHSVGGLIAKSVLIDPMFPKSYVRLIISLASPLKAPVLATDKYIVNFYKKVEDYYSQNVEWNQTTFVSIGGGNRDLLVRSELTYDKHGHINVLSTAIPGIWSSNDHLNIVWCKQLTTTIIRALFDCINMETLELFPDHNPRHEVFKYHLLKRSTEKALTSNHYERFFTFDQDAFWHEKMLRQFSMVNHKGCKMNSYIMFRLEHNPKFSYAYIEALNLNIKDWVFVCAANAKGSVKKCEIGENMSNVTEIAPISRAAKVQKKFVYLNLFPVRTRNFTHIIINIPKTDNYVQVNVDIHDNRSRTINHSVPSVFNLMRNTIIRKTATNGAYYKINLIRFERIWQGFTFGLETLYCRANNNNAVVSFMIPWAAQHSHHYVTDKRYKYVKLTLTSTRPRDFNGSIYPYIALRLEPSCTYRVTIQSSLTACASQIVIYFTGLLPSYMLTALLLTIREQILHLDQGEKVYFHTAMCSAIRRYYIIIQATIFGSKILGLQLFTRFFPMPDLLALEDFNEDFFVLTLIMYAISVVIIYSAGLAVYLTVFIIGKVIHKISFKKLICKLTRCIQSSARAMSILHHAPIILSALLISLGLATSGALSMCIATALYFIKITNMYEIYLEDMRQYSARFAAQRDKRLKRQNRRNRNRNRRRQLRRRALEYLGEDANISDSDTSDSDNSVALSESDFLDAGLLWNVHFHMSLFLLWALLTFLNLPSLLAWLKNYHSTFYLERDPCIVPSIILHICGALLWQPGIPHPCRRLSPIFSAMFFAFASVSVIYGSVSLYRLSYIICTSVLALTVYQSMARLSY